MYPTVEVRWFYQGQVPTAVFDWFTAIDDGLVTEPARTDHYLQSLSFDGIGIKLREGRIEIKQRVQTIQTVQFGRQISGIIEQWQKWGFLLAAQNEFTENIKAPQWIAVAKSRWIQSFRSEWTQKRQARFPELTLEADCRIELTELLVLDKQWWTLGLESYGDDETAVSTKLLPAAAWAFSSATAPQLNAQASFSYPQWLLSIT